MSAAGGQRPAAAAAASGGGANVKAVRAQLELADQDCLRVSAPDYTTPFKGLEDAVDRLLPFHIFGAEDPQQTDLREVEAQHGTLATSRHEAWQDYLTQKVDEWGGGLMLLEKKVHRAEAEALQRSQLPLLMLQSYATAEAQAMMIAEQQRPATMAAEREAARQADVRRHAEQQRQAALAAQQAALAAQQAQQQAMLQQQMQLQQRIVAQQQAQQAAAAAAVAQQQHRQAQQAAAVQQQQQQPVLAGVPAGLPGVVPPAAAGVPLGQPLPRPPAVGLPPGTGLPQMPMQQAAGPKPMDAKAKALAALAARINQRK